MDVHVGKIVGYDLFWYGGGTNELNDVINELMLGTTFESFPKSGMLVSWLGYSVGSVQDGSGVVKGVVVVG